MRIADEHGARLAQQRFAHDENGIGALIALLAGHHVTVAAIERPDGLLVGRLLAAGVTVLAMHPNQVAAARDRFRAAAGKSDEFDSYVLFELARTDAHRFAVLAPSSDETTALRALVRTREDLVAACGARQPAARPARRVLARWPPDRRRRRQPDRPRLPGALPQPR